VTDTSFTSGAIGLMGRADKQQGADLLFDNVIISRP
jgi:hypothetical protein